MVKSTTTSVPRSRNAFTSPTIFRPQASIPTWAGSMAATRSRSAASVTARQTSWPMRPPAPTTPTFWVDCLAWACIAPKLPGGQGRLVGLEVALVEGTDGGQRARRVRQLLRHGQDVRSLNPLDARQDLVDREHLTVQQHGRAEAAHAGARVLVRKEHVGTEIPLGHGQLPLSHALGGQEVEL